ncbi:phosphoglycerate kinase [Gemelliphila asaccharolytica]|uniref:Phosphoglycerate kinase n=1 Tax=Gemelliphila asaccharolytica TaxID=502393 RepID=A0ABR5TLQ3_9BACL|nr:phosphoglycerate kinase [Gemella asaccharolytica]KXB57885.1 phosphoglycerate kinase [Gemella asaccharolytica]
MKKSIKDLKNLEGKTVLMRADFNVPLKNGVITNDNRIVAALETIKYILGKKAKLVIFSHLGRIKEEKDKKDKTLLPVAKRLSELLNKEVKFINKTRGKELEEEVKSLKNSEILMFENTRFEDLDGKKESKNDPELGKYWASLGDIFVNDAFGTAHRAHASNKGIASNIKKGNAVYGFLIEKEIKYIGGAVDNPKRPLIAIIGGAKVSDKIAVIENLLEKADKIIIGGAMAYTFFKAQGKNIGKSLCEEEKVEYAKNLLEKAKEKIVLPVDTVVAKEFKNDAKSAVTTDIKDDEMGLDIGEKSVEKFAEILKNAKTVIWNGPMGVFEMENFAKGTIGVCKILSNLKDAITIIGGGDSATAAINLGYKDKFTHISTGGGASLEYLEGKTLPGIESLSDKE